MAQKIKSDSNCDNCGNNKRTDFYQVCKLGFIDKMMNDGGCKRWAPEQKVA